MRRYTGKRFSGEAVLDYQFISSHFNISPSTLYNEAGNPDTWIWPIIDEHFSRLNNRDIHEPSGEKVLLNRQQAAEYINKDTTTIYRMVKDCRLVPVIVTANGEKRYRREDLEKIMHNAKPLCFNLVTEPTNTYACKSCYATDCKHYPIEII